MMHVIRWLLTGSDSTACARLRWFNAWCETLCECNCLLCGDTTTPSAFLQRIRFYCIPFSVHKKWMSEQREPRGRTFPLLRNFWVNSFEFLCRSGWRLMMNSHLRVILVVVRASSVTSGKKVNAVIVLWFQQQQHIALFQMSAIKCKRFGNCSWLSEHIIYVNIIAEPFYTTINKIGYNYFKSYC
jgi:hypothetical protein